MPAKTTSEAFDEFDESLKLHPLERAAAEALHTEVTNHLRRAGLIMLAFLQGSFARKTMIPPLRDVDKVVILASGLRGLTPWGVMNRIQRALQDAYPDATFERTRHSLKVDFGPTSFYFDTVPAWETETPDDDVLIANTESGGWDRSNSRQLIRTVASRNHATRGRFIHQARMGKQAIKHLTDGIVPGLHVESWAYIAITCPMQHDEACAQLLATGAALLGGAYYEPTGVDLISAKLKPDVIAQAKPIVSKAATDARLARHLTDAGDHVEATRIWHGIFGDYFPAPPSQDDGAALRRSYLGGGVTSAGTVSTVRSTHQPSPLVRPWRPH